MDLGGVLTPDMKLICKFAAIMLLIGMLPLFHGCEKASRDDSNIPWARPAHWEGGMPGMGPMQDRPRY